MCFIIHEKHQFIQVATEPITVFKTVYPPVQMYPTTPWLAHYLEGERCWYSEVSKFCYRESNTYTDTDWGKDDIFFEREKPRKIRFGFHSYESSVAAFRARTWPDGTTVVVEFEIPIGAEYYYNPDTGEYVSEKITCIKYYPLLRSLVDGILYPFLQLTKLF
jgi:hypothetical protein